MGVLTKIQWTDHTFNPWIGCTKVSPGCKNCYAEADMDHRRHMAKWGDGGTRHITSASYWKLPLKWDREARESGERRRVFCASLADVFEDRPELVEPRRRLAKLIWQTQNLDWLFLTKRPEFARWMIYEMWFPDAEWPKNWWLGTSVEDQDRAIQRVPDLLRLRDIFPEAILFLSLEPLLGPVGLAPWLGFVHEDKLGISNPDQSVPTEHGVPFHDPWVPGIDWVIVGGESGRNARPCNLVWVRSIIAECRKFAAPVFVKQMGSRPYYHTGNCYDRHTSIDLSDSKGGDPSEWPEDIRLREFPIVNGRRANA